MPSIDFQFAVTVISFSLADIKSRNETLQIHFVYSRLGQEWRCHAQKQEAKPIYYSHPTQQTSKSVVNASWLTLDHFGGGRNKNWNQDNFVKLSNSLVSEKNMAASVQYVTLPWTCTVRFVSSCPAIYNIWQQSGLTKSCLSFQNKRPTDDAPILTQIAAYPCTSWERNLITIEV